MSQMHFFTRSQDSAPLPVRPPRRIDAIDLARTLALLAMIVFHLTFDLALFGHIPPDTVYTGFWPWFARGIASSFLFLTGVSLWLAHGQGIRWRGFLKRLLLVVLAAAAISLATWLVLQPQYIRWGILHMIAAGSLIGLLFLRLPAVLTLAVAAACYAAPLYLKSSAFDAPWLLWLGLAPQVPAMMDYEPVLPWLCPVLAGIACARIGSGMGLWQALAVWQLPGWLTWPGRHSLTVYLLHQPIMFGALFALSRLWVGA